MQQKETHLKNAILDYLKYAGVCCWLTNNMGNYNPKTKSYYKNPRLLSGVADILGLTKKGILFAIECKVGKNKQSIHQELFEMEIKDNNGIYILAYKLEDITNQMNLLK